MHEPVPKQGAYLRSVLIGHMRYYAVPMNNRAMSAFRQSVQWLWWKTLKRRSQKLNMTWRRMEHLTKKWLPPIRVYHPYPLVRFGVVT